MATETLYALFQTVADAERSIGALMDHGIDRNNIGVVARRLAEQDETARVRSGYNRVEDQTDALGDPVATYTPRSTMTPPVAFEETPRNENDNPLNVESVGKEGITTTTGADAGAGAAIGSGVGLIAGLLASAAALTIPGFGLVLAGGAFAAGIGATVATTAAGAIAGGVAGYLRDMGMDEAAAASYAERVTEGDYLISVTADTSAYDDIRRILYKYNAVGVDLDINQADRGPTSAWIGNESIDPATATWADNQTTTTNPNAWDSDETIDPAAGRTDLGVENPGTVRAHLAEQAIDAGVPIGAAYVPPVPIGPAYVPADRVSPGDLPPETVGSQPLGQLGSPAPVRRIITEEPDGTPIIPAREIEEVPPSAWRDPAIDAARAQAAEDHDADVDDAVRERI